jgi:uncharacterized membrane protein YfcA
MDGPMLLLAAAVLAGGFVRGFAGFGAALVIMPIATIAIEPSLGVIMMCLIELPSALWLLRKLWRIVRLREIVFIAGGALVASPIGVQILLSLDAIAVRWIICILILLAVALLASGWRYARSTSPIQSAIVGFVSGTTGTVGAFGLPPVVLFWLSGRDDPAKVTRANILAYSVFLIIVVLVMMGARNLITLDIAKTSLIIFPFFIGAAWIGERYFAGTTSKRYTHAALAICATSAIVGLPLWQQV